MKKLVKVELKPTGRPANRSGQKRSRPARENRIGQDVAENCIRADRWANRPLFKLKWQVDIQPPGQEADRQVQLNCFGAAPPGQNSTDGFSEICLGQCRPAKERAARPLTWSAESRYFMSPAYKYAPYFISFGCDDFGVDF